MKHTAPPEGVLLLKRKGHKQHHRKKSLHFRYWFWGILLMVVICGSGYLGAEYYLKQTSSLRMSKEVVNNMQVIVNALEEYYRDNEHQHYPRPYVGDHLLSWRVEILPYFLDENGNRKYEDLYNAFKKDQPWDGPDNIKLLSKMPPEFRSPMSRRGNEDEYANCKTNYVAVVGENTVFQEELDSMRSKGQIHNLADTALIIETSDEAAVFWTKPDDFEFKPLNPDQAEPKTFQKNKLVCGMGDGSVKIISVDESAKKLFDVRPRLSPDELWEGNPWVKYFFRRKDLPKPSEAAKQEQAPPAEPHEEYRPGRKE